jgi:hypothetical protein
MVNSTDRLARFLGTLMIVGSLAGILLSLAAVVALDFLGAGDYPGLEFLVGFGILLLGATPVVMLAAFFVRAVQERRWATVLAASGLFAVLALGLFKVLG